MRNVLVHNAGHADKEFVEAMKNESRFNSIKTKDKFLVDGNIISSLINPVVDCGISIIETVDKWMLKHPE